MLYTKNIVATPRLSVVLLQPLFSGGNGLVVFGLVRLVHRLDFARLLLARQALAQRVEELLARHAIGFNAVMARQPVYFRVVFCRFVERFDLLLIEVRIPRLRSLHVAFQRVQ